MAVGARTNRGKPGPSKAKAREMLHDGTVHGKPLSKKQRGLFGAIASGAPRKAKPR